MTGAAPVPVPPPRPVVTNTMSAPSSASISLSVSSSAACRPTFGSAPAPSPLVSLRADLQLVRRGVELERLQVGVGDDELDAVEAGRDHAVDGVAAAAADADHLDAGAGAVLRLTRASAAAGSRRRWSCVEDQPFRALLPRSTRGFNPSEKFLEERAQPSGDSARTRRPHRPRRLARLVAMRVHHQPDCAWQTRGCSRDPPARRHRRGCRAGPAGRKSARRFPRHPSSIAPPPVSTIPEFSDFS